jgi:hypothetical protein
MLRVRVLARYIDLQEHVADCFRGLGCGLLCQRCGL